MTINLDRVMALLDAADEQVEDLHGAELDERTDNKSAARDERVRKSRELQLLAHRLELAAELVRHEYWFARGESDAIYDRRHP